LKISPVPKRRVPEIRYRRNFLPKKRENNYSAVNSIQTKPLLGSPSKPPFLGYNNEIPVMDVINSIKSNGYIINSVYTIPQ